LEKTYKAYLKFQVSGKKKIKIMMKAFVRIWYSKEKIKKSKENRVFKFLGGIQKKFLFIHT